MRRGIDTTKANVMAWLSFSWFESNDFQGLEFALLAKVTRRRHLDVRHRVHVWWAEESCKV